MNAEMKSKKYRNVIFTQRMAHINKAKHIQPPNYRTGSCLSFKLKTVQHFDRKV